MLLLELYTIKTTRSVPMPSFHKTIDKYTPGCDRALKGKENDLILLDKNCSWCDQKLWKMPLRPRDERKESFRFCLRLRAVKPAARGEEICRNMARRAVFQTWRDHQALPFWAQPNPLREVNMSGLRPCPVLSL